LPKISLWIMPLIFSQMSSGLQVGQFCVMIPMHTPYQNGQYTRCPIVAA
jgi:hypothetical protein